MYVYFIALEILYVSGKNVSEKITKKHGHINQLIQNTFNTAS